MSSVQQFPTAVVALVHSTRLPPTFAKFRVPKYMNKLDIRDYLFHGYGVRVLGVRSHVFQKPVTHVLRYSRRGRGGFSDPKILATREPAIKTMIVEMDKPFVWPDEPADFEPWDREGYLAIEKSRLGTFDNDETKSPYIQRGIWHHGAKALPAIRQRRRDMAQEAQDLLAGKKKWRPTWKVLEQK